MTISQEALGLLLICSVRYALGRQTAVTFTIAGMVRAHWRSLSANDRDVIRRDVQEHLARGPHGLDEREAWMPLLAFMDGP